MKNYNNDETFLARWLNNDLTDHELQQFQESEDFGTFSKIAELSQKFEGPEFNQNEVKDNLLHAVAVANHKAQESNKVKSLFFRTAIAAAVALVFMFTGMHLWDNKTTTIVTNYGENETVILPDGSQVELNRNSKLSFKEKDWANGTRKLSLVGEAHFDVYKGSKFTVHSSQGKVQVVGTKFNVKTLKDYYAVECYEGKVLVNKDSKESLLTSGSGLHFKYDRKEIVTFAHSVPNWKNKSYIYKEMPLSVVFNDLQNEYGISDLQIGKVNLKATFTGRLITNNIEKALEVICKPMDLEYRITSNRVVISVK